MTADHHWAVEPLLCLGCPFGILSDSIDLVLLQLLVASRPPAPKGRGCSGFMGLSCWGVNHDEYHNTNLSCRRGGASQGLLQKLQGRGGSARQITQNTSSTEATWSNLSILMLRDLL
jgi:hypothetical protein